MVEEYLRNKDVLVNNQHRETFLVSRRVFIELRQTPIPVPAQDTTMKAALSHASLRTEFNAASERYTLLQKAKREAFEAERR